MHHIPPVSSLACHLPFFAASGRRSKNQGRSPCMRSWQQSLRYRADPGSARLPTPDATYAPHPVRRVPQERPSPVSAGPRRQCLRWAVKRHRIRVLIHPNPEQSTHHPLAGAWILLVLDEDGVRTQLDPSIDARNESSHPRYRVMSSIASARLAERQVAVSSRRPTRVSPAVIEASPPARQREPARRVALLPTAPAGAFPPSPTRGRAAW